MDGSYTTNLGGALIAKLLAQQGELTITRAAIGSGTVPVGSTPQEMTGLAAYIMDAMVSGVTIPVSQEVEVTAQVSSVGLAERLTVTELGIYALDPDAGEILYSYMVLADNPEIIPAESEAIGKLVELSSIIKVSTLALVTATINPSALVTLEALTAHNTDPEAHPDIRLQAAAAQAAAATAQQTADAALDAITDLTHTIDVLPTQGGSLTYTGGTQSPTWNSYNPAVMTLGGTTSGTNAGTYTATFTPISGYKWWDGTTTPKNASWTIAKAAGSLTISPTSLSLTTASPTGTITVTRAGDGVVSASSSNTSVATVSVSGTTVTVTAKTTGSATITVSVAAGTNHNASANRTCSVTATMLPAKAALNSMSWADIKKVIDGGQAANYWAVGDRKAVLINGSVAGYTFSNVTSYAYILGFDHNPAREGTNKAHFQFGKTALTGGADVAFVSGNYNTNNQTNGFIMNTSNTNSGGWNSSYMRNTVCAQFKNALPSDLQAVLKTVTKWTDNTGGGSDTAGYVTSTTDTMFLLSEFEVQGARAYANSAEQTYQARYQYYINGNSKVKNQHNATTTAAYWWVRSPFGSTSFCRVGHTGSASGDNAALSSGFAPGFCV